MDPFLQFLLPLISGLLALLIGVYFYHFNRTTSCNRYSAPPQAGGAWPIIGHMHLFGDHQLTHKTLGAMADKYGPVFTIRLGSHRVLVLNSWEAARDCFTVHDKVFSNRPSTAAFKLLGYDYAMFGFAPYSSYWREMRKIATIQLLSNHRIDLLKNIRVAEVQTAIRELYMTWTTTKSSSQSGVMLDLKQWFADLTMNISLRLVVGKRFSEDNTADYQKVIREFVFLFGVFVLSDAIPFLGWWDFNGYEKAMKRTAKEMDSLIEGWLEEHKQKRLLLLSGDHQMIRKLEESDFMDVILNILEDAKISGYDADTINKATCLNLILAGADTTMVTLTWAVSLLLNNPHELKKVQNELHIHIGKDRAVEESDIKNLTYLQAVIKETLRLYPPAPTIHRASIEDCTLSSTGYHVPAGTRIMVNAWKIQRNGHMWSNPDKFQPERFLTSKKDIDFRGQNFELIPFGSGRRSCPGISLALQMVHFTLASLLHSFEVSMPPSSGEDHVDMTESNGLTNLKATPLQVLVTPCLDPKFYVH
ncbi:hypothetical protein LWI29_024369 [Acer saccharum]|uniref:Cytochrome P450 n=1 Tax=Acer saccharum TaxID=4024 RepID=A0AA39W6X1_ACESA|nr:hypothetical protein LWI29_024369 [Acer saccharum]